MENKKISTITWISVASILYLLFRIIFNQSEYGIFETEYGVEVNWVYRLFSNIGGDVSVILFLIIVSWVVSGIYKLITGKDLTEELDK